MKEDRDAQARMFAYPALHRIRHLRRGTGIEALAQTRQGACPWSCRRCAAAESMELPLGISVGTQRRWQVRWASFSARVIRFSRSAKRKAKDNDGFR